MQLDLLESMTDLDRKFSEYDRDNPEVYKRLVVLTRQAKARGRNKIGIGMLFEVIRWEQYLATKGDDYKMNNNYRSRYARKLMIEYPEFEGMFNVRELRS